MHLDDFNKHLGRCVSRRRLTGMISISLVPTVLGFQAKAASETEDYDIVQPLTASRKAFVERAFEMQRLAAEKGDQHYGAVVVRDGIIIGQSWSKVIIENDPTAHAEISAIRDAARRTRSRNLVGATLFSSARPCPMCEAAAYWANVNEMIHGRTGQMAGSPSLCG